MPIPGQPRRHGALSSLGQGARGRLESLETLWRTLGQKNSPGWLCPVHVKCVGSLETKSVTGAQAVPGSASGPLASVKGPVQLTVSSWEIHGMHLFPSAAGPAFPPQ